MHYYVDFPQAPFHDRQSLFVLTFQVGLPKEASSQSPKIFFLAPPKTYGGWWDAPMCVCLGGGECPTRDTQEQTYRFHTREAYAMQA